MKTLKNLLHVEKNNDEAKPKKTGISKLFNVILVVFMLLSAIVVSSCVPYGSIAVEGSSGYNNSRRHHHRHSYNNEQHNERNHRDNDEQHY